MNFFVVFFSTETKKSYNMDEFFSAPCCNGFQIYKYLSALERFILIGILQTRCWSMLVRERDQVLSTAAVATNRSRHQLGLWSTYTSRDFTRAFLLILSIDSKLMCFIDLRFCFVCLATLGFPDSENFLANIDCWSFSLKRNLDRQTDIVSPKRTID